MYKNRIAATLAGGMLLACSAVGATGADATAAQKGEAVYQARCMYCHGAEADGKGHLVDFLKVQPANLSTICAGQSEGCVTDRVLKAVLGRHEAGDRKMPLLKDYLSVDEVYYLSEFIKTKQH